MDQFSFSDLIKGISKYFDKDCDHKEEEKIFHQINSHPDGAEALQREKIIRDKLKERVSRPSVSPALVDKIKSKIGM